MTVQTYGLAMQFVLFRLLLLLSVQTELADQAMVIPSVLVPDSARNFTPEYNNSPLLIILL
jgi:hypothetical protein